MKNPDYKNLFFYQQFHLDFHEENLAIVYSKNKFKFIILLFTIIDENNPLLVSCKFSFKFSCEVSCEFKDSPKFSLLSRFSAERTFSLDD